MHKINGREEEESEGEGRIKRRVGGGKKGDYSSMRRSRKRGLSDDKVHVAARSVVNILCLRRIGGCQCKLKVYN